MLFFSTTIEAPQIVEMFPAYYIFNGLLSVLLVLHVIWTYFILKIVYKAMYSGKVTALSERICSTYVYYVVHLFSPHIMCYSPHSSICSLIMV